MGGNALKEYGAKRLERGAYRVIAANLQMALLEVMRYHKVSGRVDVIRAYRDKPSFGDIDVVVPSELHRIVSDTDLSIQLAFHMNIEDPFVFKSNGPVTSFGIPLYTGGVFQADLIYTKPDDFDFAVEYYSWNDLGNLIGRIAHKMGLKFGHDGLSMPLRDGDNLFHTIYLTKDFKQALEFLGYSYARYQHGFDEMDDIFRFTVSTHMFNSDIYKLENRNHTARVRDKKRPTYTAFLAWLEQHPEVDKGFDFPPDKAFWRARCWFAFPEAKALYDDAMVKLNRKKLMKSKFNGEIARELTGLEGKKLGAFLTLCGYGFQSPEHFDWFIINSSQDEINQMILKVFKNEFV